MALLSRFIGKKTIITLAVLVLLFIGVVTFLVLNLESLIQRNKDVIISKLEQAIGREVSVEGFEVSLWPGVNLQLTQFMVADDPEFREETFVKADQLNIHFKLLPLLKKEIDISHLVLHKPEIHLHQNQVGEWNFFGLIAARVEKEQPPSEPSEPSEPAEEGMALTLTEFRVKDGLLVYSPKEKEKEFQLQQIDMEVNDFSVDRAFPLQVKMAFQSDRPNITWDGRVGPLAHAEQDLGIQGEVELQDIDLQTFLSRFDMQSSLPKDLSIDGPLSSKIQVEGTMEKLTLQSEWQGNQLDVQYGEVFHKQKGVPLQLKADVVSDLEVTEFESYTLDLGKTQFTGNGKFQIVKSEPEYHFSLDSQEASLDELSTMVEALKQKEARGKAKIHVELEKTEDQPRLDSVVELTQAQFKVPNLPNPVSNLNGSFYVTSERFRTEEVDFIIGESSFELEARTRTYTPMSLDVDLSSPKLHLKDVAVLNVEPEEPNVLESFSADGLLTLNSDYRIMGTFTSEKGTFYDVDYSTMDGTYEYEDNVVKIPSLTFEAYKGKVDGVALYNMQKEPPEFEVSTTIERIDVMELVRSKFVSLPESMQGLLDLQLNLTGSGSTWEAIQPSLRGNVNAQISEGVLLDSNLIQNVLTTLSQLPSINQGYVSEAKERYPSLFQSNRTVFDQLDLQASIQEGNVDIEQLVVKAAEWLVEGKGRFRLGEGEGLQSDAFLQFSDGFSNFLNNQIKEFQYLSNQEGNVTIPFSITGALDDLKTRVSENLIQTILQKALVNQGMESVLSEVSQEDSSGTAGKFFNILQTIGGKAEGTTPPKKPEIESATLEEVKKSVPSATKEIESVTKPEEAVKKVIEGLFK